MAKQNSDKTNMYLLIIVGIVAVVAIGILVSQGFSSTSGNVVGEAGAAKKTTAKAGASITSGTCSDSDGGVESVVKGTITGYTKAGISSEITDHCYYNTKTGIYTKKLFEYYCDSNNYVAYTEVECAEGACANGICVQDKCQDTDYSNNDDQYYEKGTAYGYDASQTLGWSTDSCASSSQVTDYGCVDGYRLAYVMNCPSSYKCSDGACVKS